MMNFKDNISHVSSYLARHPKTVFGAGVLIFVVEAALNMADKKHYFSTNRGKIHLMPKETLTKSRKKPAKSRAKRVKH